MRGPVGIDRPILREYAFLTPAKLGGIGGYRRACAVTGLKPIPGGYGLLHIASEESGHHATVATWDVAWVEAIAEVQQQVERGQITDEAGQVDLSSELLREKMAALYNGWPDEWDGHSPDGVIVTAYRGDTPHSRDVGREAR